jgi:hypothetical protein
MTMVGGEGDEDDGPPWDAAISSETACQRRGRFRAPSLFVSRVPFVPPTQSRVLIGDDHGPGLSAQPIPRYP